MNRITEEQLWDLADGLIKEPEASELMLLIKQNSVLQKKYDEILAIKLSLAALPLESPSADFTSKVMSQWKAEQAPGSALKTLVNKKIIYSIAAIFSVLIITLLIFTIRTAPAEPSAQLIASSNQVKSAVNANINSILGNNSLWFSFLMIDAVLLLYFIDNILSSRRLRKELA